MSSSHDFPRAARPIIGAPMAGGPSSVELVTAVSEAGGLGMIAAGYRTPEELIAQIAEVSARTAAPFGVNLFVPAEASCVPERVESATAATGVSDTEGRNRADRVAVDAYRDLLAQDDHARDLVLPEPNWRDTDHYDTKLDVVEAAGVPLMSFTFGCPRAEVVERMHAAGISVAVTVTTREEAEVSVGVGADALIVQGAEAGGHRGTHRVADTPNQLDHLALLPMMTDLGVPLVAAGGITTAGDTRRALAAGAIAVQVGTALLLSDEAGTNAAHRMGLTKPDLQACVTRAFSGRPARGLRNAFVERYDAFAPAVFPAVDQITKPLRAASAADGDLDGVSLWAGAGWRAAREAPAASIIESLTP